MKPQELLDALLERLDYLDEKLEIIKEKIDCLFVIEQQVNDVMDRLDVIEEKLDKILEHQESEKLWEKAVPPPIPPTIPWEHWPNNPAPIPMPTYPVYPGTTPYCPGPICPGTADPNIYPYAGTTGDPPEGWNPSTCCNSPSEHMMEDGIVRRGHGIGVHTNGQVSMSNFLPNVCCLSPDICSCGGNDEGIK